MLAFPLCSIKSQLWQMQNRARAAVFSNALQLQQWALPRALGLGKGGKLLSLINVCSLRVGTKGPQTSSPTVILALEKRDVTEGVKQSGTGEKTKHTAGPTLTGPVAPLITPNSGG